jgi:hypothetical protein
VIPRLAVAVDGTWPGGRGYKSDFNDVVREHLDAVRACIRLAALAANGLAPTNPAFIVPTADRKRVATTPQSRVLLTGETGIGKSTLLRKRLLSARLRSFIAFARRGGRSPRPRPAWSFLLSGRLRRLHAAMSSGSKSLPRCCT